MNDSTRCPTCCTPVMFSPAGELVDRQMSIDGSFNSHVCPHLPEFDGSPAELERAIARAAFEAERRPKSKGRYKSWAALQVLAKFVRAQVEMGGKPT